MSGYLAWNCLFDRNHLVTALKVAADLAIELTSELCCSDPDEKKRKSARGVLGVAVQGQCRIFSLITNTLAKDKEIVDRWRGFPMSPDARHLPNLSRARGGGCAGVGGAGGFSAPVAPLYAMKAKWLGAEQLPHWDRNAPLPAVLMRRSVGLMRARRC